MTLHLQGNPKKITSCLLISKNGGQKQWNNIFEVYKEKSVNQESYI